VERKKEDLPPGKCARMTLSPIDGGEGRLCQKKRLVLLLEGSEAPDEAREGGRTVPGVTICSRTGTKNEGKTITQRVRKRYGLKGEKGVRASRG